MDGVRAIIRCHTCGNIQRDRRVYRDHLLRTHGEVSRRGLDAPVRLPDRELAAVWASARRHQTSGNTRVSRRREKLGLPRVSDREAERRLRDNRSRTARRHRAAAHARGVATAALGTPDVPTAIERAAPIEPAERFAARLGSFQARPQGEPVLTVRLGGTRRPISPCLRCRTCECQTNRDYSPAQESRSTTPRRPSHSRRQSTSSTRCPTSRRRHLLAYHRMDQQRRGRVPARVNPSPYTSASASTGQ